MEKDVKGGEMEKEIIAINVDMTCDHKCEFCEKFFECEDPDKYKIFSRRRMGRAKETMAKIKYKVAVLAGKGGVGKSMVSANLAMALALRGRRVSILDHEFDGPCIPRMLGVSDKRLTLGEYGIRPVEGYLGVQVISMGFIAKEKEVTTLFTELRRGTTEEFLSHVDYGDRDYLIVDLPPGTSSDAINLMQYIPDLDGVIAVTIPPLVSQVVVKKAILLCLKAGVRVLGVVENMSGYVCPKCGSQEDILKTGGGELLARELKLPFLGRLPLDMRLSSSSDEGEPFVLKYPDNPASKAITELAQYLEEQVGWKD